MPSSQYNAASVDKDLRWRELGAFIREQRLLTNQSLRKLSQRAGISNPYLSQVERGMRRPSAETLRHIARALHISAETLYVRAGILEETTETDAPAVVLALHCDPQLDEEQRRALLRLYWTFRAENQRT